jgi:flagellin
MISVLNSISSLSAENALSTTNTALQSTLQQLSTGLKINSGADDAAGLSIANGLGANIAALTQSSQNASNGIGMLQTADGALSQVTTLLNRAVTLATEASTGGLSPTQTTALNNEFTTIMSEIGQIGSSTNFNGQSVFTKPTNSLTSTAAVAPDGSTALTQGSVTTIVDGATGGTFRFVAGAGSKVSDLAAAITTAAANGTLSTGTALASMSGQAVITGAANDVLTMTTNDTALGSFGPTDPTQSNSLTVFTSDGGTNAPLTTTIPTLSATALALGTDNLSSTASAATALAHITGAISQVAQDRGTIGASVNRLTADTNVENTEVTNLTSAQNNVQNADIASTVAKMTQYNVLEQTGMAALSQSNQAQQSVLKLLQ